MISLLLSVPALAATLDVCLPTTGSCPYGSIGGAVAAAQNGDVVLVWADTDTPYVETIAFDSNSAAASYTLRAKGAVVWAQPPGAPLIATRSRDVTLDASPGGSFTLQGAVTSTKLLSANSATLRLSDVNIGPMGDNTTAWGGAIDLLDSSLYGTRLTIEGRNVPISPAAGAPSLISAQGGSYVHLQNTISLSDSSLMHAPAIGVRLNAGQANNYVIVDQSTFAYLDAHDRGGAGISVTGVQTFARVDISNSTFSSVHALGDGQTGRCGASGRGCGGALYIAEGAHGHLTISDTLFDSSTADNSGGAIYFDSAGALLSKVTFEGSQAPTSGAAQFSVWQTLDVADTVFCKTTTSDGPATRVDLSPTFQPQYYTSFDHTTWFQNTGPTLAETLFVSRESGTDVRLNHLDFVGNTSGGVPGGAPEPVSVSNSLFYENSDLLPNATGTFNAWFEGSPPPSSWTDTVTSGNLNIAWVPPTVGPCNVATLLTPMPGSALGNAAQDGSTIGAFEMLATNDADGDGFENLSAPGGTDCDDQDDTIHPGAEEHCDGVDEDCDGVADNAPVDATPAWPDEDADGYGDDGAGGVAIAAVMQCMPLAGWSSVGGDCDDTRANVHLGATEVCDGLDDDCNTLVDDAAADAQLLHPDTDGDTYGDPLSTVKTCPGDGYVTEGGDCDDTRAWVNPAATEVCDGLDNTCDRVVDVYAVDTELLRPDEDGDGYGDAKKTAEICPGDGYVALGGDCDDTRASVNPGATEVCDGLDNDCDSVIDDAAVDAFEVFTDGDGDGYGTGSAVYACARGPLQATQAGDCDDEIAEIHPLAIELCDEVDQNCDPLHDPKDGLPTSAWYLDADEDTFAGFGESLQDCEQPGEHWLLVASDCDDGESTIHPGVDEHCDSVDHNCDGRPDDGAVEAAVLYPDLDDDGYGDQSTPVEQCPAPGLVAQGGDCDDLDEHILPGATEVCDGADNDCDGTIDVDAADATLWYADADADGFGERGATGLLACAQPVGAVASADDCNDDSAVIYPGATEVCDGVDNDCDDTIDVDAADAPLWYSDADADGYGATAVEPVAACAGDAGSVGVGGDCDDRDASVNPAASDSGKIDKNCDGTARVEWVGGAGGCACASQSSSPSLVPLAALLLGVRRRRVIRR